MGHLRGRIPYPSSLLVLVVLMIACHGSTKSPVPPSTKTSVSDATTSSPLSVADIGIVRSSNGAYYTFTEDALTKVVSTFGKPLRIKANIAGEKRDLGSLSDKILSEKSTIGLEVIYDGMELRFEHVHNAFVLDYINIIAPGWKTRRGISIGSTESEVKSAYGSNLVMLPASQPGEKRAIGGFDYGNGYSMEVSSNDFYWKAIELLPYGPEIAVTILIDMSGKVNYISFFRPI